MATVIRLGEIRRVSYEILAMLQVPNDHQDIIVESIAYAHGRGKGTHGLGRLLIYADKIQRGLMDPKTSLTTLKNFKASASIDANNGFGQVAAVHAMDLAIEKASEYGIGVVTVRASNNFGTVGYISERATQHGMVGMVLTNSAPAIAPTGGQRAVLGTNPLGIAFPPSKSGTLISLDMATSAAARGKIRLAAKDGTKIPIGWALDQNGKPTDDPIEALKGSMVPVGEHKGYGLSLCIDILAGLLSGSGFGGHVLPLSSKEGFSNYGHFIVAVNISFFQDPDEYAENMDSLIQRVRSSAPDNTVKLPGEGTRSFDNDLKVNVSPKVIEELNVYMKSFNLESLKHD